MVASLNGTLVTPSTVDAQCPCLSESNGDSHRCEASTVCDDDSLNGTSECPEVAKSALHESPCRATKNHLERSLSRDRRRAESAQFFKAVGESPTGSQDIEIVDTAGEDSLDDEDQGAQEVPAKTFLRNRHHARTHSGWERHRGIPFTMLPIKPWVDETKPAREDLNYRGIGEAGMEITRCGLQRGNCVTLHRKAWLEVSDSKHRYGKNLRIYYRHWCSLGYPTNSFFHWLDSKGEAEGEPLPDLPACPRKQLDSDTVLYITDPKITQGYSLSIVSSLSSRRALILDCDGEPVSTGPEGWIFVLRDDILYASRKVTAVTAHSKQRFHHSSFFGGKAVLAAGIIVTNDEGYLTELHPHSGHYRPGEQDIQRCLCYLYSRGVSLDTFEVDMQQIFHISRQRETTDGVGGDKETAGAKKKQKKNCLYLKSASYAAYFLSHKAKMNDQGIFKRIRLGDVTMRSNFDDALDASSAGSGSDRDYSRDTTRSVE